MPRPIVGLGESLSTRVIPVLQPLVESIPNEDGRTISIPVRTIYTMERARWPLVTVRVLLGDIRLGTGENILWWEREKGHLLRGMRVPGSQMVLDVLARSDPERYYIVDALAAGLLADYIVLPSGEIREGAVLTALRLQGLIVTAVRSPQFPPPNPSEPRPQGQDYRASLVVEADAWFTWQTPGVVINTDGTTVSQEPDVAPDVPELDVIEHVQSFWTLAGS